MSSIDHHNLGTFGNLNNAYEVYRNGAAPGDYITVSGEIIYWDDIHRRWGRPNPLPGVGNDVPFNGNFLINGDLSVSGEFRELSRHLKNAIFSNINLTDDIRIPLLESFDGEFGTASISSFVNYLAKSLDVGGIPGGTGVPTYTDENGNTHIYADFIHALRKITTEEFETQKNSHIGGKLILTASGFICTSVESLADVYRCYMDTQDPSGKIIFNQFKIGDQAIVETSDTSSYNEGTGNHFLWRLVTGVGENYTDLSKTLCAANSDIPLAGDNIEQLGYQGIDDNERQNAIIIAGSGTGSPYVKLYTGINSFTLPEEETRLKPGDSLLSGKVDIQPGSTGWENLNITTGGVNLLRNSGFTGDYADTELTENSDLNGATPLFSNPLKYWNGQAAIVADTAAVSGFAAQLSGSSVYQSLSLLIAGESYVISFKAKGASLTVSLASHIETVVLNENYEKYCIRMVAGAGLEFMLTGTATICDIQIERGTIATGWTKSPYDNDRAFNEIEMMKFLTSAIKDGRTSIDGGLILSSMLMLGCFSDGDIQRVTSGVNGIYNDDDDVAFWAGGTLEDAIAAVAEPSNMTTTKFVVTHGGRIITNEGYFRGAFACANGKIMLNADGSGHLAAKNLMWDILGNISGSGSFSAGDENGKIVLDPSKKSAVLYNSNGTIIGAFGFFQTGGTWDYSQSIMELYSYTEETMTSKIRVTSSGVKVEKNGVIIFETKQAPSDMGTHSIVTLNIPDGADKVEVGQLYRLSGDGVVRVKLIP